jgi:hypothetical protein
MLVNTIHALAHSISFWYFCTLMLCTYTIPGNASQVTDGAAAILLTRRSIAKKLNLPILGKFVAAQTIGVPPRIMGVGPAYAIPKVRVTNSGRRP